MPVLVQVNVQNGSTIPPNSTLNPGENFQWYNPSSSDVTLKDCGNWSAPDSCTVPKNGGTVNAQVLTPPNTLGCAFYSSGWNAPGMPHIGVSPEPTPMEQKDVA
jgi:hypothetical protein